MNNRKSLILSLHEQVTGKKIENNDNTVRGRYDPATGTYYCGKNVCINAGITTDVKRYIASRYYDYTHELVRNDEMLTPEELKTNNDKAEAILQIMQKLNIPISEFDH